MTAALLFGFAALFHASCIESLSVHGSGGAAVHMMADGTIMAGGPVSAVPLSPYSAATSGVPSSCADGEAVSAAAFVLVGPADVRVPSIGQVGMILIVVGLAVLTLILFVRWREIVRSFGHPPPMPELTRAANVGSARLQMCADLVTLGISRT